MPNALRIGLLGPLQLRDGTGRLVHVGGRQLRILLTLLALNAGRVVPAGSLAGQIWPDDPPGNPGNALQTLVSRLRAGLRQAGVSPSSSRSTSISCGAGSGWPPWPAGRSVPMTLPVGMPNEAGRVPRPPSPPSAPSAR